MKEIELSLRAIDVRVNDRVQLGGDEYTVVGVADDDLLPGNDTTDYALITVMERGMPFPYPFAIRWDEALRVWRRVGEIDGE